MALQLRRRGLSARVRVISTLIAVFALVAQPVGGFLAGQIANAAGPGAVTNTATGEVFTSIQSAIDDSDTVAGNTINVAAGDYTENVIVNKAVTLQGAGAATTKIVATHANATPLTFSTSGATASGFTITHEYTPAELSSWNFNNNGVTFSQGTSGNTLQNSTVSLSRNGLYLNRSSANILNNTITNNRTGINLTNDVNGTKITGNTISDNWTLGMIYYSQGFATDFSSLTVAGNTFSENWYTEIGIKDAGASTGTLNVSSNTFSDNPVTKSTDDAASNPAINEPGFASQKPNVPGINGSATRPAGIIPTLRIYNSAGVNLVYTAPNTAPVVNFAAPTPAENSYVSGTITPHVTATDDYGMGSYYIRLWKNAFESGASNLVYNNCYAAPGASLLGTSQDVTCPAIDTTTLADGKYVLSAQFLDADNVWGQSLRTFNVDNTVPTLTVKAAPDTVGSEASKVFSKVSFKLYDKYKVSKYSINGTVTNVTPNTWSDANNIKVGGRGAVYGENTIMLYDVAGNSTSYTFTLDNVGPTVTIKDGPDTLGSGPYSKISFKLFDSYKVVKAEVNGHLIPLSPNKWSDLNNIKVGSMGGQAGNNTVKVYDLAGNVTEVNFVLDNAAPTATFTHSNNNDNTLVNTDVTSTLHASEPIQTPAGWTKVNDTTFTKVSTENNKGNMTITDSAGNSGTVWFEVKRIDKTAPVFSIADDTIFNSASVEVIATEANISKITVDGIEVVHSGTKPDYKVIVTGEGEHVVVAFDKAGNSTAVTFTIDTTAPSLSNLTATQNSNGTYTLLVETDDPGTPVVLSVDGVDLLTTSTDGGTTWTATTGALLEETNHVFSASATDTAGNGASVSGAFTVPAVQGATINEDDGLTAPFESAGRGAGNQQPQVASTNTTEDDETGVLGTSTTDTKGTPESQNSTPLAPSPQGWILFGLAWYWWFLILVAVAAAIWQIVAAMRRRAAAEAA